MLDDQNVFVTMINRRGSVVYVKRWEVPLCREQGMRIINNPKQAYYPEYDEELNPPKDNIPEENMMMNISDEDLLEGEYL